MIPQREAAGALARRRRSKCHKSGETAAARKKKIAKKNVRWCHFCVLLPDPLTDQTPTPTRFLQNCEEVGLFKEIEEEFLQEQEEEKNKEVHLSQETKNRVTEIQEAIYALFPCWVTNTEHYREKMKAVRTNLIRCPNTYLNNQFIGCFPFLLLL